MKVSLQNKKLRNGVSGIMRVRNDSDFIELCVESCITALDELIIVYNDCCDNSPEVIEKVRKKYPHKIKVYEYPYKVYGIGLTKELFSYANSLPDDSPHLLANYYNFALSKVSYQYAVKIDADQLYFEERLKFWCDVYKKKIIINYSVYSFIGCFVWLYICVKLKFCKYFKPVYSLPLFLSKCYLKYVTYRVSHFDECILLSGLNTFRDNNQWLVPYGDTNSIINVLPPYNGVGDHMIFPVSESTYYEKYVCEIYNTMRSESYTLIEKFVCNKRKYPCGFFWFHLNIMRNSTFDKVLKVKSLKPYKFEKI